ncbi:MAG: class I SAM-dependent methyltransferase, partial [Muribaculaceae bacterium]|nr:class I SAM-dependent methyltransferase [Muribaculaceae bacterium]
MQPGIDEYIHRHISPEPEYLRRIDRLTNLRLVNGRMCSGHTQGRLLKMLTAMIRPRHVLELGTFSGYSALCMAEALEEDASLDTVEVCDELEDFIRENLSSSPYGHKVRLHIGDALDVMRQWDDGHFDLIFIDADKREYREYYRLCLPLLKKGG